MSKYNWHKKRKVKRLGSHDVEVLHWGRRTGKTTAMIRQVRDNPNGVMIVPTEAMARNARIQNEVVHDRILSAETWLRGAHFLHQSADLYVDEAALMPRGFLETYLNDSCPHNVKAVTFSTGNRVLEDLARTSTNYNHRTSTEDLIHQTIGYMDPISLSDLAVDSY